MCGCCGASGRMWKLKSGLLRCEACYRRILESHRAAREDEAGLCQWPREVIDVDGGVPRETSERPWLKLVEKFQAETSWYR